MNRIKIFCCFLFLILAGTAARATHNRAGEITFKYLGPYPALTYEITITTYTRTSSTQADRPALDSVYFGDGSPPAVFIRTSQVVLGNDISRNTYVKNHTYLGNGVYEIRFEDPNRNEGVINIPNSVEVPFYVSSQLVIDPFRGLNSSPILAYPPIDRGCVGRIFVHNANAYDPDGDSLSYELTVCRGRNGNPIPGYTFPAASGSFSMNSVTGDLTWDSPLLQGEYNIAFRIYEWRNGVQLGFVTRDMQVVIGTCNNFPPQLFAINDTCVVAGDTLQFDVTAIDPDGNNVQLTSTGGPYLISNPATFVPLTLNNDTVRSRFTWATNCNHIQRQPYYVQYKAKDQVHPDSISLVSLSGTFIRVIGPAPQNAMATPSGNAIQLNWDPPACTNITGYRIYRRNGSYPGIIPCPCDNGAPAYTGYTLLDTTKGLNRTSYLDNNKGIGLVIGVEYCYLITAVYADGSEGCASAQVCASLKKDLPVITNVDIRVTDNSNGSIYIAWSKPTELDSVQNPPPYQYRIFRSTGFTGTNPVQVDVLNSLNDTTYIDTLLDTRSNPWSYKIELYYTDNGNPTLKGSTTIASSVFLSIAPSDNILVLSWLEQVPWNNHSYDVFKFNTQTSQYDSLGTTTLSTYTDSGLVNGESYCYYIRSSGSYTFSGFIDPIINRSQEVCSVPVDNVHPCATPLMVQSFCLDNQNKLVWNNPNSSCSDDVLKYYIYYAASENSGFERIDSVLNPADTIYFHRNLSSLAGCYKVTGIDSVGNETINPLVVCVDTCRQYVLPSVFTPNNDGKNDLWHPCDSTTSRELQEKNCPPYKNVKDILLKVYNRWGNLVFETTDKDVNWDGKHKDSGEPCKDGVYYYTCDVNFFRVSGEETVQINGYVHLLRNGQ